MRRVALVEAPVLMLALADRAAQNRSHLLFVRGQVAMKHDLPDAYAVLNGRRITPWGRRRRTLPRTRDRRPLRNACPASTSPTRARATARTSRCGRSSASAPAAAAAAPCWAAAG